MNSDKAYVFGLIMGGGHIGHDSFSIVMPFKQWGEIASNPDRAGRIAADILERVQPIFRNEYGVDVTYSTKPTWMIQGNKITSELRSDLKKMGYPNEGDIRSVANIGEVVKGMSVYSKRMFIAGLADTIGSLAKSHRRFTENYQVISFEFKSNNFLLVSQIVNLLSELNCHPDQILWNHPNQHSGRDRYYKSWKKGFKIRVALDDYITNGSFIFLSKIEAAQQNNDIQSTHRDTGLNAIKLFSVGHHNCVHIDESSTFLPKEVRGYHFIHNQHIAAAMGCNTAPVEQIKAALGNFEEKFTPFTKLTKGSESEIESYINNDDFLNGLNFKDPFNLAMEQIVVSHQNNPNMLMLGTKESGYPVSELLEAIIYVYCASNNQYIHGKRLNGGISDILDRVLLEDKNGLENYSMYGNAGMLAPLVISNGNYSALVGPYSPVLNKKLITKVDDFRFRIRSPKLEELHV